MARMLQCSEEQGEEQEEEVSEEIGSVWVCTDAVWRIVVPSLQVVADRAELSWSWSWSWNIAEEHRHGQVVGVNRSLARPEELSHQRHKALLRLALLVLALQLFGPLPGDAHALVQRRQLQGQAVAGIGRRAAAELRPQAYQHRKHHLRPEAAAGHQVDLGALSQLVISAGQKVAGQGRGGGVGGGVGGGRGGSR
ncbi:hypothetical protein TYRP_002981 [Tyrophagus putrescentiae]|nr:hypothetical protein TYRP_002981 [Tyrophagus putrescentiae]